MTLRTPRRRISPRTKRRYRAIKDFLRRALGTTASEPETKTNSNISVSVSDLKHKIVGIEKQLDQVSQHCRDLITVDNSSRCGSLARTLQYSEAKNDTEMKKPKLKPVETKLLYKTSEKQYKNLEDSDFTSKLSNVYEEDLTQQIKKSTTKIDGQVTKSQNKFRKCNNGLDVVNQNNSNSSRLKQTLDYKNYKPSFSTASYYSSVDLVKAEYSMRHKDKRRSCREHTEPILTKESKKDEERRNNIEYLVRKYEDRNARKKYRREKKELDKDFIADIIRRQYKPVKLFHRKESGLSQLSVPLCRDQDFSTSDNIHEGSELCSCCYDDPTSHDDVGYRRKSDFSDVRSICDTRLYSSKRYPRCRQNRRNQEYYNDCLYDLIPVKEKSSPKSRKKFTVANVIPFDHYKEVPPSPRSLRPRLNLKAQHYEAFDDPNPHGISSHQRMSLMRPKKQQLYKNLQKEDNQIIPNSDQISYQDQALIQTSHSLEAYNFRNHNNLDDDSPYPTHAHNQTSMIVNDLSLSQTQDTDISVDKTDKALCEIKDILQSFLEEIKRETPSDKSETSDKNPGKTEKRKQEDEKANDPMFPNSSHSFNYTTDQCPAKPYMPAFPNTCCYPILPVCPINYVQNGFVIPSQSYTCTASTNHLKESTLQNKEVTLNLDKTTDKNANEETQQLIKEIYNYVKQSPKPKINAEYRDVSINNTNVLEAKSSDNRLFTSRSVGGSCNLSVHDVQVGTSQMKCHSKSCEAFGSKKASDTLYSNGSYSDTVLEKLCLEAAATQPSDFDLSSILNMNVKPRKKKTFSKVLQSFGGLLRKKRKDVIEELSESESTVEVDAKPSQPYRQRVTNYMMHGEEYYQPPPFPSRHAYQARSPEHFYRQSVGLEPRLGYPHSPLNHAYDPYAAMTPEQAVHHGSQYPGTSPSYSTSFDHHYNQVPPQVPLCMKEIEVKSIATQSEKKKSFLETLKRRMAQQKLQMDPLAEAQRSAAQMTKRTGLLNWKNLQEKAMQVNSANLNFSFKETQKQLTETDMTIRNAMVKRFFYKKNPFSSKNPIVQTLLGKDKPMEEPSNLLRGRMFL